MTSAAFLLVILSGACHATWNLLLKQSGNKVTFLDLASGVGALAFMPLAVGVAIVNGLSTKGVLLGCITGCLHGVYGLSLARGYRLGDLSTVYPVARGMGLALVPVFAAILLGENVSPLAIAGIALVVAGIYGIHMELHSARDLLAPLRSANSPAGRASLLTGALIACYYLWDKNALDDLSPVVLNQFAMAGHFLVLLPFAARNGAVRREWSERRNSILAAGLLVPFAYILVLAALETSRVSYIAPAREVGIVFGTVFGVVFLAEGLGGARVWAAMVIVAGVVVLALAP
jgi:multidrug transporter EmrE-like cation transporter